MEINIRNSAVQLDFFERYDEFAEMKKEIWKTRSLAQSVQRGVFSRVDAQKKHILALYEEIELLKFEIEKMRRKLND